MKRILRRSLSSLSTGTIVLQMLLFPIVELHATGADSGAAAGGAERAVDTAPRDTAAGAQAHAPVHASELPESRLRPATGILGTRRASTDYVAVDVSTERGLLRVLSGHRDLAKKSKKDFIKDVNFFDSIDFWTAGFLGAEFLLAIPAVAAAIHCHIAGAEDCDEAKVAAMLVSLYTTPIGMGATMVFGATVYGRRWWKGRSKRNRWLAEIDNHLSKDRIFVEYIGWKRNSLRGDTDPSLGQKLSACELDHGNTLSQMWFNLEEHLMEALVHLDDEDHELATAEEVRDLRADQLEEAKKRRLIILLSYEDFQNHLAQALGDFLEQPFTLETDIDRELPLAHPENLLTIDPIQQGILTNLGMSREGIAHLSKVVDYEKIMKTLARKFKKDARAGARPTHFLRHIKRRAGIPEDAEPRIVPQVDGAHVRTEVFRPAPEVHEVPGSTDAVAGSATGATIVLAPDAKVDSEDDDFDAELGAPAPEQPVARRVLVLPADAPAGVASDEDV